MKRRDLVQHLTAQDCQLLREGVRHSWWHHTITGKRSAVPRHTEINNHLERFAAILGMPGLIGSDTAVKNAPSGRWTAQKRAAFYLDR